MSNHFVDSFREALGTVPNATRTTTDGRQYPAKRKSRLPTPLPGDGRGFFDKTGGGNCQNPVFGRLTVGGWR